jgi:hypothetical protein
MVEFTSAAIIAILVSTGSQMLWKIASCIKKGKCKSSCCGNSSLDMEVELDPDQIKPDTEKPVQQSIDV